MTMYPEGRFYEAEFPEVDDIVVVQVKRIVDMGAYVHLLEYDGREGMMLLSELSKRRIRSVSKLLRVGRIEICMVLRVDQEKGYIDLSKRRVAPEDGALKEESFAKAKAAHSIMRHVASTNELNLEDICTKISWAMDKKYGSAFEAFRRHIQGEINMWEDVDWTAGDDLSAQADKIKEDIESNLRRKLIQQMLKLRAKVEVSCSEYEGIDAIREALLKGMEASKEECEVKIKLIAHPTFVLTCVCRDKTLGIDTLTNAMNLIKESIEGKGGAFEIKLHPELVGQDEKEEEQGSEDGKSGDEDSDSDESEQDETMGNIDEQAMKELMEKTKDLKVDEEDDE